MLIDESKGEEENPWGIRFSTMFHMTNDSHLFRTWEELEIEGWSLNGNVFVRDAERYLPLYEAKMAQAFDHRAADVVLSATATIRQGQPIQLNDDEHRDINRFVVGRYWLLARDIDASMPDGWTRFYLLGFTDVTSPTNERTMISTVIPRVAVGHTMPLIFAEKHQAYSIPLMMANLNSFVFDYVGRQKIGGIHYTYFILKQLPVLTFEQYPDNIREEILRRVLELTYTGADLKAFADDVCAVLYQNDSSEPTKPEPFVWDVERRFPIRCELDAIYFHLYGIERYDIDYIMETFPIVKRKDEQKFGEYRTKRVILECYDAMAEAKKIGRPYQTILDPLPADPRAAHPQEKNKT
ncbi:MAG: hypothetical protein KAV83_13085 [Desulfobacterales bacterium]|nr:hypothetical protein [Desulfobacterales bacterium]